MVEADQTGITLHLHKRSYMA